MKAAQSSTHKKVVVRKSDRESVKGYVNPASYLGEDGVESAATLDDVKGFFRTYYAPNNASLAIAGDVSVREVRRLVEKYFGDIPSGPPAADRRSRPAESNPVAGESRSEG